MVDPRISVINDRLKRINSIIAVSSGKGGVGKSLIASTLSLILARRGFKVGLFDIDFTSPSTHLILNVRDIQPREENGIIPPEIHGIRYMSIIYYSGDHPLPLRGTEISDVLVEMLAITRWGDLDFLLIDMPPGISDATLDIMKLIRRIKFLIVATPSQLALETVRRLISILLESRIPVIGVIENMKTGRSDLIREYTLKSGIRFWGEIDFDRKIEDAIGRIGRLVDTAFYRQLEELTLKNLQPY